MVAHWLQCLHILLSISFYFALSLAKQKKQSSRKRVKEWWREDARKSWPQSGVCACVSGGKCAAGLQRRDAAAANSKSAGLVPRMKDGWRDGSFDCSDHRHSAASESMRIKTRLRENSYSRQEKKRVNRHGYGTRGVPLPSSPSTLKHGPLTSYPTALLVNCQSHHSPWKDTRDTWLRWWLTFTTPAYHEHPPGLRIIHTLTEKNRACTIKTNEVVVLGQCLGKRQQWEIITINKQKEQERKILSCYLDRNWSQKLILT